MASNTENLNLLMKNPSTDGADTFNVQTMLNDNWQKIDNNAGTVAQTLANILKPTTPPIIGLPPSTTPDGMFQALAHTGDLHVWRKTVVVGSYYIGASQGNYGCICRNTGSASFGVKIQYASEITVDGHENRNLVSPSDMTIIANNSGITSPSATSVANTLKGKFIRLAGIPDGYQNSELKYAVGSVFYCPESISCFVKDVFNDGNHYICLDGIKNVPTKTENVVTYPVSTNRNAYQEGNDAKPAGYTLGEVVTGSFMLEGSYNSSHPTRYNIADTPTVSDDGSLSIPETQQFSGYGSYNNGTALQNGIKGKFIQFYLDPNYPGYGQSSFRNSGVVFIPENVVCTNYNSSSGVYIDRYQPVTGYAAIPANTTIEYLGCLGDKARVQVVSYVGTGTYGSSNPNSLTFDFVPKAVFLFSADTYNKCFVAYGDTTGFAFDRDATVVLHVSWNGKNISWFNTDNDLRQHNVSGYKYRAIAIG